MMPGRSWWYPTFASYNRPGAILAGVRASLQTHTGRKHQD